MDSVVFEFDLLQDIVLFFLLYLELVEHFIGEVSQFVIDLFGLLEFLFQLLDPFKHVLLIVVGILFLPDFQLHYFLF